MDRQLDALFELYKSIENAEYWYDLDIKFRTSFIQEKYLNQQERRKIIANFKGVSNLDSDFFSVLDKEKIVVIKDIIILLESRTLILRNDYYKLLEKIV